MWHCGSSKCFLPRLHATRWVKNKVHKAKHWALKMSSLLYTTISQSYMTGVAMERYFHSEKYWSIIKKMYQNSYSLHVAIKTGAMWRSVCSARSATSLSDNDLFTVVTHSVIYRAFHILVPWKKVLVQWVRWCRWSVKSSDRSLAMDSRRCVQRPKAVRSEMLLQH